MVISQALEEASPPPAPLEIFVWQRFFVSLINSMREVSLSPISIRSTQSPQIPSPLFPSYFRFLNRNPPPLFKA